MTREPWRKHLTREELNLLDNAESSIEYHRVGLSDNSKRRKLIIMRARARMLRMEMPSRNRSNRKT